MIWLLILVSTLAIVFVGFVFTFAWALFQILNAYRDWHNKWIGGK
jgi:hypothetical protein